ncbi:unnamed protein product [Effrenium voratum]|nr:unnamed protein product [Effrenium voratum]CAJ1446561.1 unnamed protein product [Effrenium voratum]|mmetsp:Transcript_104370/g.248341  ORF Transcript_104370/g.248341 Transcript_104370/m.248341 type:complete len:106 (-) Transcript_104370:50-367(-)
MSFKVPPHFLQVAVLALALSLEVLLPPVLTEEIGLEDVEETMLLQTSMGPAEDMEHSFLASVMRRLLRSGGNSEACARRTTLWTVAAFGFAFLQSGVKDVVLLSI